MLTHLATHGPSTPRGIAESVGIDRATVYRLLETLAHAGFVQAASGGRYSMTVRIPHLAAGYRVEDILLSAIGPALYQLHQAVIWPVSYSALRGNVMVVEESTLAISPYAIHSLKPGTPLSILRTSVGRAVLAAMSPSRRGAAISRILDEEREAGLPRFSRRRIADMLRNIETAGYAHNVGDLDPKMSGLALPLIHRGEPIGALNVIFFTKGASIRSAAERYLPPMRKCIARLQETLEAESRHLRDAYQHRA